MRQRMVLIGAIGVFCGFWVLRALFGGDGDLKEAMESPEGERGIGGVPAVVVLVEPRISIGVTSPTAMLRSMYPALVNAEDFCWEETTSDYDADTRHVPIGFAEGEDPPPDLLEFFAGRRRAYDDYEYKWFTSRRLVLMWQEIRTTKGGRVGPAVSVLSIVRTETPDGRQFWDVDEAAAVAPCD